MVVADVVCGRYGCGPTTTTMVEPLSYCQDIAVHWAYIQQLYVDCVGTVQVLLQSAVGLHQVQEDER